MGKRFASWVLAYPCTIAVVGLILTFGLGAGLLKIEINNDLKETIPRNSNVRLALEQLEDLFGSSETLVVMVRHPEREVFSKDVLKDIRRVSKKLKRTKGVAQVQSLATADRFRRNAEGSLVIEKVLKGTPKTATDVAKVRRAVFDDPDIRKAFLAPNDPHAQAIYVDPKPNVDDIDLVGGVRRVLEKMLPDYELHMTGMAAVRIATNDIIKKDMLTLVPGVAVVLTLILAVALRVISGVLFTLLLIFLSILPAAGVMGLAGIPLSAQTNTFPILVLAIACADSIHILSVYYQKLRAGADRRASVRAVVEELALPVFLTSITSAAGFLSLLGSPIPPMGGLGMVVAAGIMWAWLLSTFVLPAVLLLVPTPTPPKIRAISLDFLFRWIHWIAGHNPAFTFFGILAIIGVLAGIGVPRLDREVSAEKMFPASSAVRVDADAIDKAFQSGAPMEVIVHGSIRDPEVVQRIHAFAQEVTAIEQVGSVDSIAGIVARITERITGERQIPDDPQRLAQSILLYSISGSPDRYQRLVSTKGDAIRITVRLPNLEPGPLDDVLERIDGIADRTLGDLDASYTGKALIAHELSILVVRSALLSIFFSLALVFLICAFTFRSFWEGLEGMVPLAFAILGVYGVMGLVGIPLTIATALISSIVIGVGVDYGVHVLARWDLLDGISDHLERLRETIHEVGRPILFNAFAVAAGLAVLGASRFEPIRQLGIMAVLAMAGSAFGALVLIPTLKTLRKKER